MLSGNLSSFKKRAVGLDLNQVFTEEEVNQENEKEKEKEETDEEGQNSAGEDLYQQEEKRVILTIGEPEGRETGEAHRVEKEGEYLQERCFIGDLKLSREHRECDVILEHDLKLNLEVKNHNCEETRASSSHGYIATGQHEFLPNEHFTNYLELCENQREFSPKRRIVDGLNVCGEQGASDVTPDKDHNNRDDMSLNLEEKSFPGTLEGHVVGTRRRSLSPVSPPGRKRYASPASSDAHQSRKHKTLSYPSHRMLPEMMSNHYVLNRPHSSIADPSSRKLIERDLSRSPRQSFLRMHIEQDLSGSPRESFSGRQIKGDHSRSPRNFSSRRSFKRDLSKSPKGSFSARLIERDHSRSPGDFSHNEVQYQDLSPPLVSLQQRTRRIRGSYSRTPPHGYRHSHRARYSPEERYPQTSQSLQNSQPRKRPWTPPPNRNTGIGKPGRNLFIAGFSFNTTEKDLERKFSLYGHVRDVRIVRDKRSGDSRGFGFLSLGHDEAADAAIRGLDKTDWNGRIILVEKAKSLD